MYFSAKREYSECSECSEYIEYSVYCLVLYLYDTHDEVSKREATEEKVHGVGVVYEHSVFSV
jgi:hypothetical protein